jgi:hypothetical protein
MTKYITFYNGLLNHLPVDIIKYMMSMMIVIDYIHLRLSIMESMFTYLNITELTFDIQNTLEIQEIMLIKMYEISQHPDVLYQNFSTFLHQIRCTVCKDYTDVMFNDVVLCNICHHKLLIFNKVNKDIDILNSELKELKNLPWYNHLKNHNINYNKKLFVSLLYVIMSFILFIFIYKHFNTNV